MNIKDILKRLIEEQGISILEITKNTKISFQTIQKILEGKTKSPQAKTLRRLADYFGVTIRQIRGLDIINKEDAPGRLKLLEGRLSQLENQMFERKGPAYKNREIPPELLIACPSVIDAQTRAELESKYLINIIISRLDEKTKNAIFRYLWIVDRFKEFQTSKIQKDG